MKYAYAEVMNIFTLRSVDSMVQSKVGQTLLEARFLYLLLPCYCSPGGYA